MNRWVKYLLLRPLLALLVLLVLGVGMMAFLALSNTGTQLLSSQVRHIIAGLELEDVQGTLASGLSMGKVRWAEEGVEVEANNAHIASTVEWGRPATWRVSDLRADKLVVRLPATDPQAPDEPFVLPDIKMPANVNARQIQVGEVEIWQAGDPQPVRLRDVTLAAHTVNGLLHVQGMQAQVYDAKGKADLKLDGNMALDSPHALDAHVQVATDASEWGTGTVDARLGGELQAYTVDGTFDWQYAGYPHYKGSLQGKGSFTDLQVADLQLDGAAGKLAGKGRVDWNEGLVWTADLQGKQIKPELFMRDWPARLDIALKTEGQLSDDKTRISFDLGRLQGKLRDYPLDVSGKGEWNGKLLELQFLNAQVGDNRLRASGKADDHLAIDWQINAPRLKQLHPALQGQVSGKGTLHGQPDGSNLQVQVAELAGKVQDYRFKAQGGVDWDGKSVLARDVLLESGVNHLRFNGKADDTLGMTWQLDAPDLQQFHPELKGNARGKGELHGLTDGSKWQLTVTELAGKLQDRKLSAKGMLAWYDARLTAQDVRVESGGNRLTISGQASEPFDLQWQVDAPDLASAWPGLGGRLQGKGVLRGTLDVPDIQADLQGSRLRFQDYRITDLMMQASHAEGRYTLQGRLQGLENGETVVPLLHVEGTGTLQDHRLTAQATHAEGALVLTATGRWQDRQWNGSVDNLSLRDTPAGNWELDEPVRVSASAGSFSASSLCLISSNARACAKPVWQAASGLKLEGVLQHLPLVMLRPWLPDNLTPAGTVDADYRFEQRGGKPVASAQISLPDSSFTLRDAKGKAETVRYANARADLTLNDRVLDGQLQADLPGYGQVRSQGQVSFSPEDGQHRINATLNASLPDIAWAEKFSPQIDQLRGRVNADLQLDGLLSHPALSGQASLVDGQVRLPEAGVTLQAIRLDMQASGTDRAIITGTARAGQGILNANGTLSVANLPNWQADVRLQGSDLKLMDTYEAQVWVSPDLRIQASPATLAVTGNVLIPETLITLRELPANSSALSDDVVIVGSRAPKRQQTADALVKDVPLDIQPDVVIELGDKVKLRGFGFDARLTGKLHILRTRQDIMAEGVLSVVDGVYKAYGQNLEIERGRLLFNGPLDNPGLDVRALRKVEDGDIEVGIELAGTVQQPESTLFSSPLQSQSDTLSYLLTGRAMSTLDGDQSSLLMDAITGLGIAGGESIAQQIGGRFGLDVGLKARDGNFEQSELALGRRLGPRLYVRYIVGLFDSLQRIALTYQINKRLQVQAESGLQQGIDLIYKVDTNRGPLGP